jgi:RimJ/RimL family protein N-acetyltransferase
MVKLRQVSDSDFRFLYQLLSERDPIANISHKKIPTYSEHVQFVKSKPYTKWYIIYFKGKKSGSIYLSKQDEIGIFIKKEIQDKGIGTAAMISLIEKNPRSRFLANVSPKNKKSAKFFKKNGFSLIQYTYVLERKKQ